jgi:hypothetical protein
MQKPQDEHAYYIPHSCASTDQVSTEEYLPE